MIRHAFRYGSLSFVGALETQVRDARTRRDRCPRPRSRPRLRFRWARTGNPAATHAASPAHAPLVIPRPMPGPTRMPAATTQPPLATMSCLSRERRATSTPTALRDRTIAILRKGRRGRAGRSRCRDPPCQPRLSGVCHAVAHDLGTRALRLAPVATPHRCSTPVMTSVAAASCTARWRQNSDQRRHQPGHLEHLRPGSGRVLPARVGHGVMFATKGDVEASMDLCDQLAGLTQGARCAEGLMMQLWNADAAAGHAGAGAKKPEDALRICLEVREPYGSACWFYSPRSSSARTRMAGRKSPPGARTRCRRVAAGCAPWDSGAARSNTTLRTSQRRVLLPTAPRRLRQFLPVRYGLLLGRALEG